MLLLCKKRMNEVADGCFNELKLREKASNIFSPFLPFPLLSSVFYL